MLKITLTLGVMVAVLVAESSCQGFILPTYRPPVRRNGPQFILPTFRPPVRRNGPQFILPTFRPPLRPGQIRFVREAGDPLPSEEPTFELHTELPGFYSNNRREARSLDSPSAKRGGGGSKTSTGSRNTGATHPGYNRRNAREIRLPGHLNPLRPKPLFPRPTFPAPVPRIPILARTARDIQFPGVKKPSHRDVIIPNWNPHVKTSPWDRLGGRRTRSLDIDVDLAVDTDFESHERVARDVHVSGIPEFKKPTYRDVVIPNWNPNVKTNPWDHLGGRRGRSIDYSEDLMEETEGEFGSVPHEREAREVHISGLPEFKKPSHRDVIIPNWNPHVRTNPWQRIGGRNH